MVFAQIPASAVSEASRDRTVFLPPLRNVPGSRIVSLTFEEGRPSLHVLTPDFASASSPVVSFDGKRIAFAGKKAPGDPWNIWEMDAAGQNVRRILESPTDCMTPAYLPSIYTLDNLQPRDQMVFASAATGALNESGYARKWSLFTCEMNGENLRRITFNLGSDFDPTVLPDGRILYTSWQHYGDRYAPTGLFPLLTVNTDGTDLFPFYGNHELPALKCRAVVGPEGWVYFVESNGSDPLGGGSIAAVNLRRNLKTYTRITGESSGVFSSPYPRTQEHLLVSYRTAQGETTYGLYDLERTSGRIARKIFDDPAWHEVDAQAIVPRGRPAGRSSVVNYTVETADILCIDCSLSDQPEIMALDPNSLSRLRVIEGIELAYPPEKRSDSLGKKNAATALSRYSATPFSPRRILGEIPLSADKSFYIRVPASLPLAFQVLDENNMAVATHRSWMWAMPKEARACVGCHEDRELTPPNRLADSLRQPAFELTAPPENRRTVDFEHEISPLISGRCFGCHDSSHPRLNLQEVQTAGSPSSSVHRFPPAYEALLSPDGDSETSGKPYVRPGSARRSPLIWHLFGKRTDREATDSADNRFSALMPPNAPLSKAERNLFIEWIDLGAQWSNRPSPDDLAKPFVVEGTEKGK
jgi:hypothetical protein